MRNSANKLARSINVGSRYLWIMSIVTDFRFCTHLSSVEPLQSDFKSRIRLDLYQRIWFWNCPITYQSFNNNIGEMDFFVFYPKKCISCILRTQNETNGTGYHRIDVDCRIYISVRQKLFCNRKGVLPQTPLSMLRSWTSMPQQSSKIICKIERHFHLCFDLLFSQISLSLFLILNFLGWNGRQALQTEGLQSPFSASSTRAGEWVLKSDPKFYKVKTPTYCRQGFRNISGRFKEGKVSTNWLRGVVIAQPLPEDSDEDKSSSSSEDEEEDEEEESQKKLVQKQRFGFGK